MANHREWDKNTKIYIELTFFAINMNFGICINAQLRLNWTSLSVNNSYGARKTAQIQFNSCQKKNGNTIECMLCVFGLTIFANIWFNLKTQQAGKNIFLNIYLLNFCIFSKKEKKIQLQKLREVSVGKKIWSVLMQVKYLHVNKYEVSNW